MAAGDTVRSDYADGAARDWLVGRAVHNMSDGKD